MDMEKDAKALLEKAKAERKSMSSAESKGAAPAPSAEKAKTEDEVKKAEQAEADKAKVKDIEEQAKKDEEILSKKEEELDEDGKKRKAELIKVKDVEDKEKKSNVQKRFDELTGKIKALESDNSATKAEKETLKAELDGIKKQLSITPQDKIKEKVKLELSTRQTKYLEEDKTKDRKERREMDDSELDEWALEDYKGAQEWITKRTIRRHEEEKDLTINEEQTIMAEVILDKQRESAKKIYDKHPEIQSGFARLEELKKEKKTKQEVMDILHKENPKFAMFADIYAENPNKYMVTENTPELIAKEMEKRLKKEPETDTEKEDLKKKLAELQAENERLSGLDLEVSSTRHIEPKTPEPEIVKKTEKLGEELGLSKEQVKKAIDRRKNGRY